MHCVMICRTFERVTHAHTAAQQIQRKKQRAQQQVLEHVCAFVIAQTHTRVLASSGTVFVGKAQPIHIIAGVQDHHAQRDRTTRAPRPTPEHQRALATAPVPTCACNHADKTGNQADQRIGERPQRAQPLQHAQPKLPA
ncbi:hypothetical protein D3C71_1274990 [compost metagenome]